MADNVQISAGTGTVVAADDIASVYHQRVKISLGADGSATDALGGAGAVAAGVQRVTLANDDPAVVDLAAIEVLLTGMDADTDAIKTAVEALDNAVETGRLAVNLISGQAGITAGAGAVGASTPRVTLASDDPAVALLTTIDADTGALAAALYTEDAVAPANPVGLAMMMQRDDALGGLTPIEGDWTHPFATAEGALWVQDFNSDAILALLTAMDADTSVLAAAVAGAQFQVDIAAISTTLTVDLGANNDVTATGNVAHDAADSGNPLKIGGKAETTTPTAVADADRVDAFFDAYGRLNVLAGGLTKIFSANFTRPADTTQYASGDLVANSTTAASVAALSFSVARITGGTGLIRRAKIVKSDADATGATFRLHFFDADPCSTAPTNGDNGALSLSASVDEDMYMGSIDIDLSALPDIFAGGNVGWGAPTEGQEIAFNVDTVYCLIEARGTYTPASSEVFDVFIEVQQD